MENNSNAISNERPKKFMFLRIGAAIFALPLASVREVLGLGQMSPLPNMPPYFAGLINLRGKIVSAVHLRRSLNFTQEMEREGSSKRPCVVITEVRGRLFGAIADDVVEVCAVSPASIEQSVEGTAGEEAFAGIIKREKAELAPILNLERALRLNELIPLTEGRTA